MRIAEIFHSLQGEGKLAGVPSAIVRTSGCNLRCAWCDTPYASWNPEGRDLNVQQIVDQVRSLGAAHVVVTGGEPLIMSDIAELCQSLRQERYHVTVETAATIYRAVPMDLASLSPKLANSTPDGGQFARAHEQQRLRPEVIQQFIDESADFQLKFVVREPEDLVEIEAILKGLRGWRPADVLLMPEGTDEQTLRARRGWIVDICKARGYRFCPRLHVELFGNRRGT